MGVFSFPGCLSHLGPPPRLLSSPAENHRSLQYHFTAVSAPAAGTPAFWVSGWLGPQQYLSYNNLRGQAEPCGAWVWESQVSWYWEKETTDLRYQQTLFLQALQALGEGETGASWAGSLDPRSEGGGDGRPPLLGRAHPCMGAPGPFTMQGLLGCELGPDNVSVPVAKFALNGEEFMMFDPKLGIWDGDWPESRTVSIKWTQQPEAVNKEKTFLLYSCPHRLLGHLERGRGNLEWKGERPPDQRRPPPFPRPHPLPQPLPAGLPASSPPCSPTITSLRVVLHPQRSPAPLLHTALPWLPEPSGHGSGPSAGLYDPTWHGLCPSPVSTCPTRPDAVTQGRLSSPQPSRFSTFASFTSARGHWCQVPLWP